MAKELVETSRVLRPGGTLCMDSPNRAITEPLEWNRALHTHELALPEVHQPDSSFQL